MYQFVDSLDADELGKAYSSSNPVRSDFVCPVLGWRIEQVKNWFITNVQQKRYNYFANDIFLVLDGRTMPRARHAARKDTTRESANSEKTQITSPSKAKDQTSSADHDNEDEDDRVETETILLCSVQSRLFKRVRCDFWIVKTIATYLEYHNMPDDMREGALGICWRSGIICTQERYRVLSKNGMRMVKGVPEVDQSWRDFAHEWREDGPNDVPSPESSDDES